MSPHHAVPNAPECSPPRGHRGDKPPRLADARPLLPLPSSILYLLSSPFNSLLPSSGGGKIVRSTGVKTPAIVTLSTAMPHGSPCTLSRTACVSKICNSFSPRG